MDETFEIEITEQKEAPARAAQLPMNILPVGEIENDDVKVYIKQDVYKALEKYALADTKHERGTIILGDYHEELGKTHVVISNYIEARYTDASASTLTFTHETWDYVHKEHDAKYPDRKIVGWQHTHPNYGIFLSNYDLFIHENFFNLPFQVAYVIDPVQNLRGFFQWKNGKIEKLKGFYLYDDVGKPIKVEQSHPEKTALVQTKAKSGWLEKAALALALLIAAGSLIGCIRLKNTVNRQNEDLAQLRNAVSHQHSGETGDPSVNLDDLNERIETQQNTIDRQQGTIDRQQEKIEALEETVASLQEQLDNREAEYVYYTVMPGDSLGGICARLGIDYWKNRGLILGLNHIENENVIAEGQTLIFPSVIVNP